MVALRARPPQTRPRPPLRLVPPVRRVPVVTSDPARPLGELALRFQREMVVFTSRQLRNNVELGSDFVQDVWLSMSKPHNRRKLESLDDLAAQKRYLFRCLNNRIRDHYRQIKNVPAASALPLSTLDDWHERDRERVLFDHLPAGRDAAQLALTREALDELGEAIRARLPKPWQRAALGLLLSGYTVPQIVVKLKRRYGDDAPAQSTLKRFSAEMTRWIATLKEMTDHGD